ncbi:MAG: threonylcarbamoyl-AMP synthase [Bacteroidetes bacterium]|nr:threonylcarbamoyl-AMP synthase [Bacteroidota bacterium]
MKDNTQYEQELANALETLRSGGTLLYPTDTIWGLGCDATNPKAVEKIFRLKNREESKSLIVLLDDETNLHNYVDNLPEITFDLLENLDKPTTIIYSNAKNLAWNVIANDGTVGIRVTRDPFCKDLVKRFGKPIVSTSANISGDPSPVVFREISKQLISQVSYTVDLYHDQINSAKPSTIIRLMENGEFIILRN